MRPVFRGSQIESNKMPSDLKDKYARYVTYVLK